ncbi:MULTISPECIES: 1-deoxy-D-xylulose-5-phosphate synthase [Mesonia]|uniref:1-deoxy-D-xylulose-5-phosphate synthase n=1 Tax=Mesonia oceanica TaxID=2687242 RepID=A0AC61Y3N6_9FLAO|nr:MULTISPECIES: 1-deoxy-D-xylulose-5-phosphate synthase [Mesonia]MAN26941.1 1-deoxy-D-xylulose-5-phosphate synthase [Mesonia sp.]MAQ40775.1 1-deoxy-D-xylulose-5-phosphate synthase [Mesonia sp.]MBJ98480.1 1-deoxy-D-xylulose-5-phosphate synthase [Flavobacteriaceae bacterium]VVU99060.1 1-deoxy-D-xylulose-5-phosphate synthase [Mesonia oceanica]
MTSRLLQNINAPKDLRKLDKSELLQVAKELREFIIDIVATKEGHLGASLGVVELSIALHYYFNTPEDVLVWDVGHQAYGHKILTGRRSIFDTNRKLNGLSGFPKRNESEYDTFGVGHSSTSISAALGMAIASRLNGNTVKNHIAVIGDASIASGMAFEGLNHAGVTDANLWVILNDNAIGIDLSVGALKEYLSKSKIGIKPKQDNMIEALNFHYSGPIDGHNFDSIFKAFEELEKVKGPKFLHLITKKGKGLRQAEENQVTYHAPGKFDKKTGELLPKNNEQLPPKFQDVFGLTLVELAKTNKEIIGITPAMPTGSSLKYMMQEFPDRAFDVGIAEQHAVTLAAGMATQGKTVFCTIYSTFLQRAYDQLIHDVALQNLPVIFCVDRAGLVGEDGATHHGVFDIAYLRCIPNLIIATPADEIELRNILYTSSLGLENPIAIRYPRGRGTKLDWQKEFQQVTIGKGKQLQPGNDMAIISVGTIKTEVEKALGQLQHSEKVAHYDLGFVKPLDEQLLTEIFQQYQTVITIEDGVISGGAGEAILAFAHRHQFTSKIMNLGVPDEFIEQGTTEELKDLVGISAEKIKKTLQQLLT